MDEYVKEFKKKKSNKFVKDSNKVINIKKILSKFLIAIIFFLLSIIFTNYSDRNLLLYKEYVFTESMPFTKVKSWYENLFGKVLPNTDGTQMVFDGKLIYKDIEDYYEGEKLNVGKGTLINNITSGIVVYIGNKDNYNNTVIIQGIDGVDIWYGNLTNVGVKLYDYIDSKTVLGETIDDNLYLVIKKDKEYLKYETYKN